MEAGCDGCRAELSGGGWYEARQSRRRRVVDPEALYLSPHQATRMLGVPEYLVYRLVGEIPGVRLRLKGTVAPTSLPARPDRRWDSSVSR